MKLSKALLVIAMFSVALVVPYQAEAVSIAGYVFDDNAFPDAATYVSGGPPTLSFTSTGDINQDLLLAADADLNSYIYGTPVTFYLDFLDNWLVNDTGADLVLFELGVPDAAVVNIRIDTGGGYWTGEMDFLLTDTGYTAAGFNVNAAAIDLDVFGIASGELISRIELNNDSMPYGGGTISSSIAAVGALNSAPVPEPATMLLLGSGLIGLAGLGRKKLFKRG